MPNGKPAGVRCIQLLDDIRCELFGQPERPAVCLSLRPMPTMCGLNRLDALRELEAMERATAPQSLVGERGLERAKVTGLSAI